MISFRVVALTLILALHAAAASRAEAADTPAAGGSGGAEFRAECPSGEFLAGLEIRYGKTIDAIAPLCARYDGERNRLGKPVARQWTGSTSAGRLRALTCSSGSYLSGIKVSRSEAMLVSSIQASCREIESDKESASSCVGPSGRCRDASAECPSGSAATGIHGRSGASINALGVVCGPKPGAIVAPKPMATVPPPEKEALPRARPPAEAQPPAPSAEDLDDSVMERRAPAAGAPGPDASPPATRGAAPRPPAGGAPPAATTAPPSPAPPPAPAPSPAQAPKAKKKMASPPAPVPAQPAAAPDSDGKWRLVPVFYGTDRAQKTGTIRLSYSYERGKRLEVGRALVSVPTSHQVPNVERPWALTIPGTSIKVYEEAEDPAKHFTMREIKAMGQDELLKLVKERLKGSKSYKDQALIFIHGYNTDFDNAVYRTAQIAHDLSFDGAPFLYSWPSKGELTGYTYDGVSNEQAEPYLREFVEFVAKKSGAKQVSVIAHSMGNRVTLRVLKELKTAKISINQIIFAAPDVDRDTFASLAKDLKGLSKGITLYAAANDKALLVSKSFNGGSPRAGDVPTSGPVLIQGMDTIDVTTLSMDALGLNHSTYAERTALIDDIARLLRTGTRPPIKRTPTLNVVKGGLLEYWKFPAP